MKKEADKTLAKLSHVQELYAKLSDEVSKTVVGKTELIKLMLMALLSDGNILLEGVPGVAKTLIAKSFAKSLSLSFKRIQFTPDMLPADIVGTYIYNQKTQEFLFRRGPVFANIILADEINRATPKTQSALLEAMQEKQVTVEGATEGLPDSFMVIATQNPVEQEGTYPLPEAQLDRFMFRIIVGYPTFEESVKILELMTPGVNLDLIRSVSSQEEINRIKSVVSSDVHVSGEIMSYIVALVETTRKHADQVILGASPRAATHLLKGSKVYAAIEGRDYVIPDDVKQLVFPTLNHRVILRPEFTLTGSSPENPFDYRRLHSFLSLTLSEVKPPR